MVLICVIDSLENRKTLLSARQHILACSKIDGPPKRKRETERKKIWRQNFKTDAG